LSCGGPSWKRNRRRKKEDHGADIVPTSGNVMEMHMLRQALLQAKIKRKQHDILVEGNPGMKFDITWFFAIVVAALAE